VDYNLEEKRGDIVKPHEGAMRGWKAIPLMLLVVLLLGLLYGWSRWGHEQSYVQRTDVRPGDFPSALVAPDNAMRISYSSPSSSAAMAGEYHMSFVVEEAFPGEKLWAFIGEHLKSRGWKRLRFDLLNPQWLSEDKWFPQTDSEGTRFGRYRKHDWLNAQGEHISVAVSYSETPASDPNRAYVELLYYDRDAWPREFIERYKQQHPKEFWPPTKEEIGP
jgi:hypothetical protein